MVGRELTLKQLLISCVELSDIKLRCFRNYIPNTMKEYLGENKISSNTIKFLKESGIFD